MPGPGKRFQRGQSGNPSGRPKQDQNIMELARAHGPRAIEVLAELMDDDVKASASVRVMAAERILDRAYGKAPSFSTTNVGDFKRAVELSDDELIRIAAEAGLKLDPPAPRPTAQDAPASVGGNVGTDQNPPLGPNDIN
jgi:hypothetical protein